MIAFISKNTWSNPLSALPLALQRKKLKQLARRSRGYRGLQTKWTIRGVYFMTLWKTDEALNDFMSQPEVQAIFDTRIRNIEVHTIRMAAINFIPWREVTALMTRNSKELSNTQKLVHN
ncbi:hypothetical protein [Phaeocystidibacter luteus]|uniref:Uncharacterized protein n=1 Tax=Phaeocystidibacter luteus TaxID=911197 RepID=A0A6N6RK08_9FLAO|nr:hypothetical protein [Phaeocystidibacter luteus]KAB2814221.1 hypothetical protein F8C67_00390 [Phaeocystidibacter luteus]